MYSLSNWTGRSRWPRSLRHTWAVAGLLGSRVRIPLKAWMFVSLCLLCVVQVAASATSWSLVQRSPTGCVCLSVCWSRNLKLYSVVRMYTVYSLQGIYQSGLFKADDSISYLLCTAPTAPPPSLNLWYLLCWASPRLVSRTFFIFVIQYDFCIWSIKFVWIR
jgi:hypothetical protein